MVNSQLIFIGMCKFTVPLFSPVSEWRMYEIFKICVSYSAVRPEVIPLYNKRYLGYNKNYLLQNQH